MCGHTMTTRCEERLDYAKYLMPVERLGTVIVRHRGLHLNVHRWDLVREYLRPSKRESASEGGYRSSNVRIRRTRVRAPKQPRLEQ
jgi:hypothetical protein